MNKEIVLVCIFYAWVISLGILAIYSAVVFNITFNITTFIVFAIDLIGGFISFGVYFLISMLQGD